MSSSQLESKTEDVSIKYLHASEQNTWEYQNSANMSYFQSAFFRNKYASYGVVYHCSQIQPKPYGG
jgi:hypothetical protein